MMVLASLAPMNLTGSHCGQILFRVKFELLYAIDFKPTEAKALLKFEACVLNSNNPAYVLASVAS